MEGEAKTVADSPDALHPMGTLFQALQVQIAKERNQDPVPQFATSEIERTTKWIRKALAAMRDALDSFSPTGIAAHDDAGLSKLSEDARRSCIDLNQLISDGTRAFGGEQARGAFTLTRETQSCVIKNNLKDFSDFMKKFGVDELLGDSVDPEFKKMSDQVIRLLSDLQNPTKVPVPALFDKYQDTQRGRPYKGHPYQRVPNSPKPPQQNESAEMQLNELAQMAEEFAKKCKDSAEVHSKQMRGLETKMRALKTFLDVLLEVPDVYRRFVLLHVSKAKDPSQMKPWVRKEEAMASLRDFERLRDAIVEEKVLRRLSSSSRRAGR